MSRAWQKLLYFLAVAAATAFVAGLVQTSLLPRFPGLPADLMLLLTAAAAFYLGAEGGALAGLVCGVIIRGLGGGLTLSEAPLFYALLGAVAGALAGKFFRPKLVHWTIFCAASAFLGLLRSAALMLFSGDFTLSALGRSLLPEWLFTLLLGLALAHPLRLFAGALRGRRDARPRRTSIDLGSVNRKEDKSHEP